MKFFKRTCFSCLLLTIALTSHAQNFKLEGKSLNFPDGTRLLLQIATTDLKVERTDSTEIKNNEFHFSGPLKAGDHRIAILSTADLHDRAMIWLEPKALSLAIKKGDFDHLTIKGSLAATEFQQLAATTNPIQKQKDSVARIDTKLDTVMDKNKWEQYTKLELAEKEATINFVKSHPQSIVATFILNVFSTSWGKPKTNELYQGLSAAMKQSSFGQQIDKYVKLSQELKVGDKYVDFELTNVSGKKVKLSAIKGKYILLDFWGSWCGPCRHENANLVKAYHLFKDKGFNILGVGAEADRKEWLQAIKADGLPWENVTDVSKGRNNSAVMIYSIYSFPTNFLIDEQGIIIAKNLRGDDLTKKLEELLR
ncbi:AhpC/TSA family protein [Pedobacter sp. KR3-3]|uniref:AhpC/TSA family protein n=1 Tax=Pedobacter albus TaxID=3113905 RepID=A0ABU7ICB4_9SPHI|nr:AhpC/TSA family protein [Pedobacter sp. KR3-3]MEE1947125.1 AhpC/TSA family protein [Pedobacter sp. KR3-3]